MANRIAETLTTVLHDWEALIIIPRALRTLHQYPAAIKYPQIIVDIIPVKMDISTKMAILGLCSSNRKT